VGPLLGVRVLLSRNFWRVGPAWAVLAGAVASGASLAGEHALLRLIGAMALADAAWGAVWRLTAGRVVGGLPVNDARPMLPYARPDSPAGRLTAQLQRLACSSHLASQPNITSGWQELMVGLVLTGGLGLLLGMSALALSLVALSVLGLAWALRQRGAYPAFLYGLLNVGLPWMLGVTLAEADGVVSLIGRQISSLALAAAFTALQWATGRAYHAERGGAFGVWSGQLAVLAVLIGLREVWALAIVTGLFLPPSWWLLWATGSKVDREDLWPRCAPWWWVALLVTAVAVRG
jgi:hypothetical protein